MSATSHAAAPATVEDQMADVEAILDAVGSSRAALVASGGATAMAVMFAATHAARVSQHELKGLTESWQLFAASLAQSDPGGGEKPASPIRYQAR